MTGTQFWADCDIGGYESSLSDMDSNGSLNGNFTHDDETIISDTDNMDCYVITQ